MKRLIASLPSTFFSQKHASGVCSNTIMASALARFFRFEENRTTAGTEVRAGVTTFVAMAYIIFTNPAILSAAKVPFRGAAIATCFTAGLLCIAMGVATNYPMCLAAGMGLNAVVTFNIAIGMHQTWQTAMGVIAWEGIIVLLLSATAFREAVMDAIPASLKHAIAAGIGLFITFIGMQEANFIAPHPATLITYGDFTHPVALLAFFGLLITGMLLSARVRGALLIGIFASAVLGMLPIWHWPAGVGANGQPWDAPHWGPLVGLPMTIAHLPRDWSTFFAVDLRSSLSPALLPVIFACLMTDFFDTMGTAIAVGARAGYLDANGRIPRIRRLLIVDSFGAIAGGVFGCSSNTCYIESTAGAAEGGRTGLTAITCGILFLLAMFFTPLIAVIGGGVQIGPETIRHPVTAPALIVVGFLMMDSTRHIDWDHVGDALPSFLVMITMPLTFSITHAIGAGFVTFVSWRVLTGRAREVSVFLWIVAALFVVVFALPAIARLKF